MPPAAPPSKELGQRPHNVYAGRGTEGAWLRWQPQRSLKFRLGFKPIAFPRHRPHGVSGGGGAPRCPERLAL
ncbi:hypothetical protein NDU88_008282 [Pleurodeles waltl]|uniref:Uncharacterized protein n=1 Tax=Pleurodeles waltl TaxID=8319 RepID=A0AAV7QQA4_PLEWA|nr:hypothetical protein NDU88_008282 [Pleurodeles waltl]